MKYKRVGSGGGGREKSESATGGPFGPFSLLICLPYASRRFHKEAAITATIVSSRHTRHPSYFIFIKTRHNFTGCNRVSRTSRLMFRFDQRGDEINFARTNELVRARERNPLLSARHRARSHKIDRCIDVALFPFPFAGS